MCRAPCCTGFVSSPNEQQRGQRPCIDKHESPLLRDSILRATISASTFARGQRHRSLRRSDLARLPSFGPLLVLVGPPTPSARNLLSYSSHQQNNQCDIQTLGHRPCAFETATAVRCWYCSSPTVSGRRCTPDAMSNVPCPRGLMASSNRLSLWHT